VKEEIDYGLRRTLARIASRLYRRCPVCGHRGAGLRLIFLSPSGWVCACPLTPDDEAWAARLVAEGR
jgi:hypothetical protein